MKTRFSHASAFGLVTAMAVIIFSLTIYLLDLKNSALNYLSYPILITVACVGVKKWREQSGGFLTYGQTYAHLMLQTVMYSVVITVWTLLFILYIAPGMMEDQMLIQEAKFEENGMSQSEIDMAMGYARKFSSPAFLAIFAFLGNIIFMAIVNLIIAAIMKKDPPPFSSSQDMQNTNFPPQA